MKKLSGVQRRGYCLGIRLGRQRRMRHRPSTRTRTQLTPSFEAVALFLRNQKELSGGGGGLVAETDGQRVVEDSTSVVGCGTR